MSEIRLTEISPSMRIDGMKEFAEFLEEYDKEIGEFSLRVAYEIPPFYMPNWPPSVGSLSVRPSEKRIFFPVRTDSVYPFKNTMTLRRADIQPDFVISEKGDVIINQMVEYTFTEKKTFSRVERNASKKGIQLGANSWNQPASTSGDLFLRMCCFILFTQFLEELCADIKRQLQERTTKAKAQTEEYELVIRAVQKSFEPLIPFLVADTLAGKGGTSNV